MITRLIVSTLLVVGIFCTKVAFASPVTAYTDSSGNSWAQLSSTLNLTWLEIAAVCPQDGSSSCNGSLNGMDVTGWIWATNLQVNSLVREITGLTSELDPLDFTSGISDLDRYLELDSAWAPNFLSIFDATLTFANGEDVIGWTSSAAGQFATTYRVRDGFAMGISDRADVFFRLTSDRISLHGAWLYQAEIPEPATALLLAGGLPVLLRKKLRKLS